MRIIFRSYLKLGSLNLLMPELRKRGIVTKVRRLKTGETVGGIPFTRGPLAHSPDDQHASFRRLILGRKNLVARTGPRVETEAERPFLSHRAGSIGEGADEGDLAATSVEDNWVSFVMGASPPPGLEISNLLFSIARWGFASNSARAASGSSASLRSL